MGGGETEFRKGRDVTFYQNDYLAPLLPKLAAGRQGGTYSRLETANSLSLVVDSL